MLRTLNLGRSAVHVPIPTRRARLDDRPTRKGESLRKHMFAVEAAVRGYARLWGEDEEAGAWWRCCTTSTTSGGPTSEDHPYRGVEILTARGYPEWVTRAILSHADYSGVPRDSPAREDAVRLRRDVRVRHRRVAGAPAQSVLDLEAPSVIKRMKDKAFARGVSRDDLRRGAEDCSACRSTSTSPT